MTQPDSSGGLGSFLPSLLDTLTGGLKLVAAGELSRRYGFSFGADGNIAVDADGVVRASAAPAKDLSAADRVSDALGSPLVVAALVAAGVVVVTLLVRR